MEAKESFLPRGNLILVDKCAPNRTRSGLIIPESVRDAMPRGIIIAAGEGQFDQQGVFHKVLLQVGDYIMYLPRAGYPIELEGKEYLLMAESDVLGTFKDSKDILDESLN